MIQFEESYRFGNSSHKIRAAALLRPEGIGIVGEIAILQQLLWEIVRLPYQPASDLYRFSPKALNSVGHRVIAIKQVVLISFPCGKGVDGYEVVLVGESVPIARTYACTEKVSTLSKTGVITN